MKILISGAGQVGFYLCERLASEGHEVVLVDRSQAQLKLAEERLNVMGVLGNGASAEVLEKAGIKNTDIYIAVTDLDEVNILSCLIAREYNVKTRVARVKNIEYSSKKAILSKEKLGVDLLINPDDAVAEEIVKIAGHAGSFDVAEFVGGQVHFIGYRITATSPICDLTLRELGEIRGMYRFIVTAIMRSGQTIVPHGEDIIQAGDSIYIIAHQNDLPAIEYMLQIEKTKERRRPRAFVLGGTRIGKHVAEDLERAKFNVKLIEKDLDICNDLAAKLNSTIIINAESADIGTLKDEGIDGATVYIAVTDNDETNILACLLARQYGAKRTIALVNKPELLSLAPSLGIDACVSPRVAAAATILKYVRRGDVLSIAAIEGSEAEAVELIVKDSSKMVGIPLMNLNLPRGAIIGAIVRGNNHEIPTGESSLQIGDRVVVFSMPEARGQVETLFG